MKHIILPGLAFTIYIDIYAQNFQSGDQSAHDDFLKAINDTVKKNKGEVLKEIMINGAKQHKPVSAIRSGLKLSISLRVQIIGNEIITQQQAIRLSDVIKCEWCICWVCSRRSARVFWSRGYDMSSNNMFKMVFASAAVRFPKFL
jgi:iron complex outermembrane receptor protein